MPPIFFNTAKFFQHHLISHKNFKKDLRRSIFCMPRYNDYREFVFTRRVTNIGKILPHETFALPEK